MRAVARGTTPEELVEAPCEAVAKPHQSKQRAASSEQRAAPCEAVAKPHQSQQRAGPRHSKQGLRMRQWRSHTKASSEQDHALVLPNPSSWGFCLVFSPLPSSNARVGAPVSRRPSHRTVLVDLTYGSSGSRCCPDQTRLDDDGIAAPTHPSGSCNCAAWAITAWNFPIQDAAKLTKPISAKALFGRAFSTTGVWLSFHVERWSL